MQVDIILPGKTTKWYCIVPILLIYFLKFPYSACIVNEVCNLIWIVQCGFTSEWPFSSNLVGFIMSIFSCWVARRSTSNVSTIMPHESEQVIRNCTHSKTQHMQQTSNSLRWLCLYLDLTPTHSNIWRNPWPKNKRIQLNVENIEAIFIRVKLKRKWCSIFRIATNLRGYIRLSNQISIILYIRTCIYPWVSI